VQQRATLGGVDNHPEGHEAVHAAAPPSKPPQLCSLLRRRPTPARRVVTKACRLSAHVLANSAAEQSSRIAGEDAALGASRPIRVEVDRGPHSTL
jgi:hypothetical protein